MPPDIYKLMKIPYALLTVTFFSAAFSIGVVKGSVPLADEPQKPLTPSGISNLPIELNAQLAHIFKDDQGTDVAHLIGDFTCTLGDSDTEPQQIRSREAVVWITPGAHNGRPYQSLELFLWQEAEIHEWADTVTTAPALFVTVATFGKLKLRVDEFAQEPAGASSVYKQAQVLRNALREGSFGQQQEDVSLRVFDPTGLAVQRSKPPARRPVMSFHSQGEFRGPEDVEGQRVISVIGRVFMARGVPGSNEYLQIQADSIVLFLPPNVSPASSDSSDPSSDHSHSKEMGLGRSDADELPARSSDAQTSNKSPQSPGFLRSEQQRSSNAQQLSAGFGKVEIEGAYLEGDVVMNSGPTMIRASRLYYDFVDEKALILDAVARTLIESRNIPLYIRAARVQRLSANQLHAEGAILTTSEFHTPHYHIGAGEVDLINRTPPAVSGTVSGIQTGSFVIRDATLNVEGFPVAYWPYLRGTVDTSETALRGLRTGYSGDFGLEIESDWHFFNVLGYEQPEGFDATLSLDYFSDRGPAVGLDADYERDRYYGHLRSYLLDDDGEDFLGRDRENPGGRDLRGRFLLRHRQFLEEDWQLTLEFSYISDSSFLEEFFEPEFDNEKEQETLIYLKKQRDNWAFTATYQGRLLDFTTQTERLPEIAYYRIGEPLSEPFTWHSENRVGAVRLRSKDQSLREFLRDGPLHHSGTTFRADSRQEIEALFDVGPMRVVPFTVVRGTTWDDTVYEGGQGRGLVGYGLRGSSYWWKTYPGVRSDVFDLDGLRHVLKADMVAWASHTNADAHELLPFDETVEGIDEIDGAALGVRQRFQTKRGAGETRRTVDVVTLDTEIGVFNDSSHQAPVTNGFTSLTRPENSITRNYAGASFIWRMNDRTALLSELNYDLNDGQIDILNVSMAVHRSPRFSYVLGYRFIEESDSNLLGFDLDYQLNEKHSLAVRELFDLDKGETNDFTVAVIRKFPRWFGALSFQLDEAEDDFGVSLSVWPEGLPQAALGPRRFTGLYRHAQSASP